MTYVEKITNDECALSKWAMDHILWSFTADYALYMSGEIINGRLFVASVTATAEIIIFLLLWLFITIPLSANHAYLGHRGTRWDVQEDDDLIMGQISSMCYLDKNKVVVCVHPSHLIPLGELSQLNDKTIWSSLIFTPKCLWYSMGIKGKMDRTFGIRLTIGTAGVCKFFQQVFFLPKLPF